MRPRVAQIDKAADGPGHANGLHHRGLTRRGPSIRLLVVDGHRAVGDRRDMDHQFGNAQQADGCPKAWFDGVEFRGLPSRDRPIPVRLDRGGGVAAGVKSLDEGVDERA